jgi:hypothetical protein
MRATLIVDGKEFELEIEEKEIKKLKEKPRKTGYERITNDEQYYYISDTGKVVLDSEAYLEIDYVRYNEVNYYSDITIAENNARADKLMRKLRRFAAEHNAKPVDRQAVRENGAWTIRYENGYVGAKHVISTYLGDVYFDSTETTMLAVREFYDELVWYFEEYKDSL